jgi:hypothetical protein
VNLTGCEIRFVFWPLRASSGVEPYTDDSLPESAGHGKRPSEEVDESVSICHLFDDQMIPDYRGSQGFISR